MQKYQILLAFWELWSQKIYWIWLTYVAEIA